MANAAEVEHDPPIQWVTLSLDNETYGINVMQVQEVLRVPEIAPVPGAPDYVIGIINLRGNVVTVVDTRKRFGLPSREIDESAQIVILESQGQIVGILVDKVAEVIELRASAIEAAPDVGKERNAQFIQGVFCQEGKLLILVDLDKLLTEEEWQEIANW